MRSLYAIRPGALHRGRFARQRYGRGADYPTIACGCGESGSMRSLFADEPSLTSCDSADIDGAHPPSFFNQIICNKTSSHRQGEMPFALDRLFMNNYIKIIMRFLYWSGLVIILRLLWQTYLLIKVFPITSALLLAVIAILTSSE
jgi:hypothetical protein